MNYFKLNNIKKYLFDKFIIFKMSEEKFDFIFVIDKKSYLKYGTMNYDIFIKEILKYANYFSGDYEINFKNEEN